MTSTAPPTRKRRLWLRVLVFGFLLWLVTIAVLWWTEETSLIPSAIFTGSFLGPVTFTLWAIEREQYSGVAPGGEESQLSVRLLVTAFAGAGLLGVVVSALLETVLLVDHPLAFYPGVAVIEETVKIVLVWLLARGFTSYHRRDGMVLGATVGFGFAAFESAGYAFNALLKAQPSATDFLPVIETQLVRGLLTPVGHGLWTALLGGALFAAARNDKLRVSAGVLGWWCVVVLLHAVWDASAGLAVALTYITIGQPVSIPAVEAGRLPDPTASQVHLVAVYSWALLTACALIGILLANRMWVKGRALVHGFPHGPKSGTALTS